VEVVLDFFFFFFVGLRKVLNANPRINAPFKDSFVCCLFEGRPNSPLGRKEEIDISKKPKEKKDLIL
jgi:hypothetical protein